MKECLKELQKKYLFVPAEKTANIIIVVCKRYYSGGHLQRAWSVARHYKYGMFHVTWITFKFNKDQLGMVSTLFMIAVPWSNRRTHQVISEKSLSK